MVIMATTTINSLDLNASYAKSFSIKNLFLNSWKRIENAQMKKAQALVDEHLKTLSNQQLADLQFTEIEIKRLKSGETFSEIKTNS